MSLDFVRRSRFPLRRALAAAILFGLTAFFCYVAYMFPAPASGSQEAKVPLILILARGALCGLVAAVIAAIVVDAVSLVTDFVAWRLDRHAGPTTQFGLATVL